MIIKRSDFKVIKSLLLILTVAACGPHYQTEYVYIPPEGTVARECLVACSNNKRNCDAAAGKAYQECLRDAEKTSMLNYTIDLNNKQISKINDRIETLERCRMHSQVCLRDYNWCYVECGGKVEPNTFSAVKD